MEVDSKIYPLLAYVLSLEPQPLCQPLMPQSSLPNADIETDNKHGEVMLNQMPNLRQPELLAKMKAAVSDVVQTRSVLRAMGERPDHEAYDAARLRITEIESTLSKRLEQIVLAKIPAGYDLAEWKSQKVRKEKEARDAADKEKLPYKAVVNLHEMHVAYEDLLKDAEARLVEMYRSFENGLEYDRGGSDVVDGEAVGILQEASEKTCKKAERRGRAPRLLPEACGKLTTLISLDISNNKPEELKDKVENQLEVFPFKELEIKEGVQDSRRNTDQGTGLREDVQLLCHATNLLGKQMFFLEEDAETMMKEYQFWMKEHETYRVKLEEEQRETQEMLQVESNPLVNLEEEILQQQRKINCLKGQVLVPENPMNYCI